METDVSTSDSKFEWLSSKGLIKTLSLWTRLFSNFLWYLISNLGVPLASWFSRSRLIELGVQWPFFPPTDRLTFSLRFMAVSHDRHWVIIFCQRKLFIRLLGLIQSRGQHWSANITSMDRLLFCPFPVSTPWMLQCIANALWFTLYFPFDSKISLFR